MQNIFKYTALLAFLLIINACTGLKVDQDEIKEANQFFESIFQDRVLDSPEFKALWDKVKFKTTYSVKFDSDKFSGLKVIGFSAERDI